MLGPSSFSVYLDSSHHQHEISDEALAVILSDTEQQDQLSQNDLTGKH
jgi:hypothetical protein